MTRVRALNPAGIGAAAGIGPMAVVGRDPVRTASHDVRGPRRPRGVVAAAVVPPRSGGDQRRKSSMRDTTDAVSWNKKPCPAPG